MSWPASQTVSWSRRTPQLAAALGWERALQENILHKHELPHGVRLQRARLVSDQETTIGQPLTHEDQRAMCRTPAAPAGALVEDEPKGSGSKRRKIQVDLHRARLVLRHVGPLEDRTAMEHAAVLVREVQRLVRRDVPRDQPEHSLPLETERTSRSTARQGDFAVTRRHDTAERAHHGGDRRPVPQRGDDQRLGVRLA